MISNSRTVSVLKKASAIVLTFVSLSAYAGAPMGICKYGTCWIDRGPYGCAPEVVDGNLKATDRTLSELAASSEFAGAVTFKAELHRIQGLAPEMRITEYFKSVGIDAGNTEQVANFIGAREVQNENLAALKSNMKLSDQQARTLIQSLAVSLAGGLR
jgi:hypothetical protein